MASVSLSSSTSRRRNRSSRLAWVLYGLISFGTLINLVALLIHRPANPLDLSQGLLYGMLPFVFAFLGALILSRQPSNVIGWLLILPSLPFSIPVDAYLNRFTGPPPNPPLLLLLALWFSSWNWILLIFPLFFIPLLFPTGQPPSPRWRWLIVLGLGMCAILLFLITFSQNLSKPDDNWSVLNPIGFISDNWFDRYLIVPWDAGLVTITVFCTASLFVRYRRAAIVEREQIKWLLFACGLFVTVYLATIGFSATGFNLQGLWAALFVIALLAIPIGITIAILRYRLFDIDVIIRRTLVYGALTLTLGLVYFGGVVLLQEVFQFFTGQGQSPVATVISTLVIAALFTPLRRRIQNDIDRRFYRKKYDAEQTLSAFSASLRQEVDLDELSGRLVGVVEGTFQPEGATIWLKKGEKTIRKPGNQETRNPL